MYSHYEQRYERSSRDYDQDDDIYETIPSTTTYRSSMTPRVTNIQRSRPTGLNTSGVSTRIYQSYLSTNNAGNYGPGLAALVHFPGVPLRSGSTGVNTAVVSINTTRQREKRDLENLNDKFAQYVEKVRFLEAHNRKLALEIDGLRSYTGQGSSRIKEMYDIEIIEANKLIDDMKRDTAATNAKKQRTEQELKKQKARYNDTKELREIDRREIDALQLQIAENEAQIALFRRRMADLEDESERYKAHSQRLSSEIANLQNEIQNELFLKTSCEVEKLALEDDLNNLKHLHEVDLTDLRSKSVTNDLDPSQFFRNELSEAIREVRNDYETRVDNQRNDLQNRYSILTNEIMIRTQQRDANPLYNDQQRRQVESLRNDLLQAQDQNNHLRNQNLKMQNSIADLKQKIKALRDGDVLAKARAERDIDEAHRQLDRIEHTYNDATTFKTNLEKEIATYRDLLESPNGLRGCADRILRNAEQRTLERPSSDNYLFNSNNRPDDTTTTKTTTTISRTYINTMGSNHAYVDPNTTASVTNSITQPPSSSNHYQTLSNIYRNIPIRDETNRNNSSRASTPRHYSLQDDTIRDYSARDNTIRDYSPKNNTNHASLIRDSKSSSSSSSESLVNENVEYENPESPEYETLLDN